MKNSIYRPLWTVGNPLVGGDGYLLRRIYLCWANVPVGDDLVPVLAYKRITDEGTFYEAAFIEFDDAICIPAVEFDGKLDMTEEWFELVDPLPEELPGRVLGGFGKWVDTVVQPVLVRAEISENEWDDGLAVSFALKNVATLDDEQALDLRSVRFDTVRKVLSEEACGSCLTTAHWMFRPAWQEGGIEAPPSVHGYRSTRSGHRERSQQRPILHQPS